MEIWQAIVLGAVQGFTEFLPVSSSGHLILLQYFFGLKENLLFYSVMMHVGTLLPVLIVLRSSVKELFIKPFNKLWCLVLATLPAGVFGLMLTKLVDLDQIFSDKVYLLSITFLLTAILLSICEKRYKKKNPLLNVGYKSSFIMGLGQAFAVLPGLSRSGTTLSFGCFSGLEKTQNANFTFLMSIPIILSAVILESAECIKQGEFANINLVALAFGVVSSAVTGYLAISFMLRIIKKASYKWFSVYLTLLSIVTLIGGLIG